MKRWLVIFATGAPDSPEPIDATFVDVMAKNALTATLKARKECPPPHEWTVSLAYEWADRFDSADDAARAYETGRAKKRARAR